MVEELVEELSENPIYKKILENAMYRLRYYANSANKRCSIEELILMEQNNYFIKGNSLDEINKITHEIESITSYINEEKNLDTNLISLVKCCLSKVSTLINKDELDEAKKLLTIIQLCLELIPSFYLALVDLSKSVEKMKLAKKKLGDSYE